MFNNNGGQGGQVENYHTSEAYHRQLANQADDQAARIRRQNNDLASWRNHCASLENTLAQWQASHARQAQQLRELEADWNELRQNTDSAIASWEKYSDRLKAENEELKVRLVQAQAEADAKPPVEVSRDKDEVQATLTALRHMNAQLQTQAAAMETDHQMEDAERAIHLAEHSQRLTQLLKQHTDLANKVSDAQSGVRRKMAMRAQSLVELQALHETVMARALCLEDDLRLEDERQTLISKSHQR